jgi:bacterioferritin-associated ferredoxin
MFLCICHAVTEGEVHASVRAGHDTADAVAERPSPDLPPVD